ncbi:hypothetical protein N7478_001008 [Penicillium angulare]|uniref:uncharacterized protein n=1 Tax=Penicillium angulare TaxID=116970 RepID=UPI002540F050|nr:uncharacterized protein N7478_001008 [Penicillium angulare]KAJ5291757.1 hypothetical protein N7478_001008 [Penicillium angulare]
MDALFYLPFISILLVPTMSSYATTLNVVFFYMTWSTLVLSHSPLRVELVGSFVVRLLLFIIPSSLAFLFDILTPSAAVHIKAHGEAGLPGLPSGIKRGKVRPMVLKVAAWSLFNMIMGTALQAGIEHLLVRILKVRSALKFSVFFPLPWSMAWSLLIGLILRESITYGLHRHILHNSRSVFTKYLAKCHNDWYHSLEVPFPLTAHYDHPLVYIIGRFIPTYLPAMLLRYHMLTYVLYLAIISVEESFAYSGYTIMPTKFLLGGIARRMDYHLISKGEGNFGPWGILDWVFSTTIGESDIEEDLMAEMDEAEIEKQVRKQLEASKQLIRANTLRRNTV